MIHIREFYYSAGKKYGWYPPISVGVSLAQLGGNGTLEVTIGDSPKTYQISKFQARQFVEKYGSYEVHKGTRLGIISMSVLEKKEDNNQLKLILKKRLT